MNDNIKAGADIHAGDGGYSEGTKEAYEEFAKHRNESLALAKEIGVKFLHYTNTDNPIDFPQTSPRYWTIVFPGDHGQHIQETWSEDQIIKSYYTYWSTKMIENGLKDELSRESCIEDWKIVHWAVETDEFGIRIKE
jgi:hypothetical protein